MHAPARASTHRLVFFLSVLFTLVTSGCALFTSHYDAGAYQNFTNLKAFHLKFLEDQTAQEGATYSEERMTSACDVGELKFREADEYARGKGDSLRIDALDVLHNVFKDNCKLARKQKKLFNPVYINELTPTLTRNYDLAIAGELARVKNPNSK